jgi:hypothetical protein
VGRRALTPDEIDLISPGLPTSVTWLKPLSSYCKRETTEFSGARFG